MGRSYLGVSKLWNWFLPLEPIMGRSYLGVSKLRELLLVMTGVSASKVEIDEEGYGSSLVEEFLPLTRKVMR
jgi:hypothetical protein